MLLLIPSQPISTIAPLTGLLDIIYKHPDITMPFDSMRAHVREKINNIFSSGPNRDRSGYQPISSPRPPKQPGHRRKRQASPKTPLPLVTYSASGGCPTRHRPDFSRHNSSDEDVTAYMEKKVDALVLDSVEKGWRVMVSFIGSFRRSRAFG